MRAWFIAAMMLFINLSSAFAMDSLVNPDPLSVLLLQYKFSHTAPPFEDLASWDRTVKAADEFHRKDVADQAVARLKAKAAGLADVQKLTVNLSSDFSDYDTQFQEYDFDLSDGTYIPYDSVDGHSVHIALTNGNNAQTWKLGPKEAAEILRRTKGNRYVTLVLSLSLLDSPAAVDQEVNVLNAVIVGYDIVASHTGLKLGHVEVESGK